MVKGDCSECGCPHIWHSYYDGKCYGCEAVCQSQVAVTALPFEIAQDLPQPVNELSYADKK